MGFWADVQAEVRKVKPVYWLGLGGVLLLVGMKARGRRGLPGKAGKHFSWAELTASATAEKAGIDNTPDAAARRNLEALVQNLLDPLRERLGTSIRVSNGYRSPALNRLIGGADNSQHTQGEAADIKVAGYDAKSLAVAIWGTRLPFDQLIWYAPERGGHVHVSFSSARANRRQTLHAPASGGGYTPWTPPPLVA